MPLLLGISFLCFVFINLIPSDPAEVALRIRQTPIITEELIAQTRAELGLDQPFLVRYAHWLWDCLHFDLGVSYTNPARTVLGEIGRCLPATLELAGLSLVYVIVLSLPIGFLSAVYKDTWFDRIMRGVVFATTAMPVYWVGLLLIWIVSIKLDLLPTSGYGGFSSLILPAFTVALSYISTYIRLIRNNMLENMREDYVLYAQARGLKQRSILVRHILKNSLQSCVTAIGMSIPQLIAGTIVVENVFAWPGVGRLCIASIFNRDYPVIQAYVLLVGVLFVLLQSVLRHPAVCGRPAPARKESVNVATTFQESHGPAVHGDRPGHGPAGHLCPWVAPNDPYPTTSSTNSTAPPGNIPWARTIWGAACSRACSSAYGPRSSFLC